MAATFATCATMATLRALMVAFAFTAIFAVAGPSAHAGKAHGVAMHGELRHAPGFTHFSYANPDAPKGGKLVLGVIGAFDSLNPLIIKGTAASGLRGYVYESLLARALDEPFSLYGHIAEFVEIPDDRSSITFYLTDKAHFSDGQPITVHDVIFSHKLLRTKGRAIIVFITTRWPRWSASKAMACALPSSRAATGKCR